MKSTSEGIPDDKYRIVAGYYEAHRGEVLGFVSSRLGGSAEAEDITQDVFLRLLASKSMITELTMPGLVYVTARNLIRDHMRRRAVVEHYERRNRHPSSAVNTLDTSYVYGRGEAMALLESGMARLDVQRRNIYRLNVLEGIGVKDISLMLGVKYKTVENRVGEARREVRHYVARLLA